MARVSAGSGYRYLLRHTATGDTQRSASTSLTAYYAATGYPPGQWIGSGLAGLGGGAGLSPGTRVTDPALAALYSGRDPVTGDVLGRSFPAYARTDGKPARQAVAGYDVTFTVPKSVSVLWALADPDVRERITQAHQEAVADTLAFVEQRAVTTRAGHGGTERLPTRGMVAVAFDHWDTRTGDPNLHTHVVIANRVQGPDGGWRSLDGRLLYKAAVATSELYDDLLADRLSGVLPVDWGYRDRGTRRTPAFEVDGIDDDLLTEFSSRSAQVKDRTNELATAFRVRHGRDPSRVEHLRLAQRATRETRPAKTPHALRDLLREWQQRARLLTGRDPLDLAAAALAGDYRRPLRALDVGVATLTSIADQVVAATQQRRTTWDAWNLHAEASRATRSLRMRDADERLRLTDNIVATAITRCVSLDPHAATRTPGSVPIPATATYTSATILQAERRLLEANALTSGPRSPVDTAERVATMYGSGSADLLDADQVAAVVGITCSGRPLDVLVGPAGTGKTVTLAVLRTAWITSHGPDSVIGLAPTAVAAGQLSDVLRLRCETTAKWLWETTGPDAQARAELLRVIGDDDRHGAQTVNATGIRRWSGTHLRLREEHRRWTLRPGMLVIVDEAAMTGTLELAALADQARRAGAKMLLVGDHRQLGSVSAGGAFGLLVRRGHGRSLTGLWRFRNRWEANATRALRRGDPACIDAYQRHDRVTGGRQTTMLDAAHAAWAADTAAGRDALLVAVDNDTVTALNERARSVRVTAGLVTSGGLRLSDGSTIGVGDLVVTRRNQRRLHTAHGGWVRNGDRWQVTDITSDGRVTVTGHGPNTHAGRVQLPAAYATEHLQLGYAVTAHRAQGVTVDRCHVVIDSGMTRESMYVAMTRGRDANTAYVVTSADDIEHEDHVSPIAPEPSVRDVLTGVIATEGTERSATEQLQQTYVDSRLNGLVPQAPVPRSPSDGLRLAATAGHPGVGR